MLCWCCDGVGICIGVGTGVGDDVSVGVAAAAAAVATAATAATAAAAAATAAVDPRCLLVCWCQRRGCEPPALVYHTRWYLFLFCV